MNESAKRRDRPIKPAEASKRLSLGLKVTPQIKERLERAAEEDLGERKAKKRKCGLSCLSIAKTYLARQCRSPTAEN